MPYSTAITLKLRLNMNLSAELKYVIMTYENFNSPFRQYFRMQLKNSKTENGYCSKNDRIKLFVCEEL